MRVYNEPRDREETLTAEHASFLLNGGEISWILSGGRIQRLRLVAGDGESMPRLVKYGDPLPPPVAEVVKTKTGKAGFRPKTKLAEALAKAALKS